MIKNLKLIGKETFNETGFFRSTSDNFLENLKRIKNNLPENLSKQDIIMTNMNLFDSTDDSEYLPEIVRYEKNDPYLLNFTLNPVKTYYEKIYQNKHGGSTKFPEINFILFDGNNDTEIFATYANVQPTLYFETREGMCCIGTFYRIESLKDNFKYTIEEIFKALNVSNRNTIECVITTCSNFYSRALHSNLLDFITSELNKFSYISNLSIKWIVENEVNCYKDNKHGNHVIVVY